MRCLENSDTQTRKKNKILMLIGVPKFYSSLLKKIVHIWISIASKGTIFIIVITITLYKGSTLSKAGNRKTAI